MATNTNINLNVACTSLEETKLIIEYLRGEGLLTKPKTRKKKEVEAKDPKPDAAPAATVAPVEVPAGKPPVTDQPFTPPAQPQPTAAFGAPAGGQNPFPIPGVAGPGSVGGPAPAAPPTTTPAAVPAPNPMGGAPMTLHDLTNQAQELVTLAGSGPLSGLLIQKFGVQTLKEVDPSQYAAVAMEVQLLIAQAKAQ